VANYSDLKLRVVSGLILAAIALGAVYLGGFWFAIFATIMTMVVFVEWASMTTLSAHPQRRAIVFGGMALALLSIIFLPDWGGLGAVVVLAAAIFTVAEKKEKALAKEVAFAALYCGIAAFALVSLRNQSGGLSLLLILFAIVWGTDIGAYFVGRSIGGPKLAPSISPGKTRSGAIGGALIAALAAGLASYASGQGTMIAIMLTALFVSVVAQAGDLFESSLKRKAGIKDSGWLIPGHGGVFDRVDGLLPAAIAFYVASLVGAV
jgi:phosphatidate cytidylyltransferase